MGETAHFGRPLSAGNSELAATARKATFKTPGRQVPNYLLQSAEQLHQNRNNTASGFLTHLGSQAFESRSALRHFS